MQIAKQKLILLVGADNGRYLSGLEFGFRLNGMKVLKFSPPPPTTGKRATTEKSPSIRRLNLVMLRFGYRNKSLRKIGGALFAALASLTIRVLRPSILVVILNSPGNQHRNLYKLTNSLGVRIISVFHGSELRPPFLNGLIISQNNLTGLLTQHHSIQSVASLAEENSEYCIAWSKTGHYFERPYACHELVGYPILQEPLESSVGKASRQQRGKFRGPFRILHAPSSAGKGTSEIRAIIKRLQESGLPIEFEVVQSLSSAFLFEKILDSDLVIDQIYADSAPSVLALECLYLRVPVLTGGWSIGDVQKHFPALDRLSIATPGNLEKTITDLVSSGGSYRALARRQGELTDLLARNWSPFQVARVILDSISDPSAIEMRKVDRPPGLAFGGFGPEDEIRKTVRAYVEKFGLEALGFSHNQLLLNHLIVWSETSEFRSNLPESLP